MTRGGGGATASTEGNQRRINLAGTDALKRAVVLHELAHHMVGLRHFHNAAFAYAYLQLVARWLGPHRARQLKRWFQR